MSKRKEREEKRRVQAKARLRAEKRAGKRATQEQREVTALEATIAAGAPAPGSNPMALEGAAPGGYAGARTFEELPLSAATRAALKEAGYTSLTAIQRAALPHALAGRDILGAAKTGSGKTLCFLIPLVERLYRSRWAKLDGLGALVLTPTRELALQIFEELVKIGRRHELSAGLLIGGKAVAEEASRLNAMNILVATPGRLLQHMDETPGFEPSQLTLLVLDEADRILDMGFAPTLDAILANLPSDGRQTLLFSATQTKSVKDLARLSLDSPEYLAVHSDAAAPTPLRLSQAYMVVELDHKMDVLWGFIKSHLASKTIVFLSTCKQVRFVYEAFRKLRPGTPLRCLHGSMKQGKRLGVFEAFNAPTKAGGGGVLFATDVAARGLDFPDVDWVVQADCPEDVAAYIHRVGRTARYTSTGRALLLLLPAEREAMLAQLAESKVPLKCLKRNPSRVAPIGPSLSALLSKNAELKAFAQGALVAYVRSVFLQPNKAVFDAAALPLDAYAESLGLLAAPQVKFLKRLGKQVVGELVVGGSDGAAGEAQQQEQQPKQEQQPRKRRRLQDEQQDAADVPDGAPAADEQEQEVAPGAAAAAGGSSKSRKRKQQPDCGADSGSDDAGDFLTIKQHNVFDVKGAAAAGDGDDGDDDAAPQEHCSSRDPAAAAAAAAAAVATKPKKRKKQKIKLGGLSGQRVVFDDDGQQLDPLELLAASGLGSGQPGGSLSAAADDDDAGAAEADGLHVVAEGAEERFARAAKRMVVRDAGDKAAQAALRRHARLERKLRRKAAAQGDMGEAGVALGGSYSSDEDGSGDSAHAHGGRQHTHRQRQPQSGGSSGSGSDADEDAGPAEVDAAYLGMARKEQEQQQQQQQQQKPGVKHKAAPAPAAPKQQLPHQEGALSVAEQEAMALQLLAAQPW